MYALMIFWLAGLSGNEPQQRVIYKFSNKELCEEVKVQFKATHKSDVYQCVPIDNENKGKE